MDDQSPAGATPTPWTYADEGAGIDNDATVTLVRGSSFMISRRSGDIVMGVDGVYVADSRILHHLVMRLDGEQPEVLTMVTTDPSHGRFVGRARRRGLVVQRSYAVGQGLHARFLLCNTIGQPQHVVLALELAGDMADLFEVKELRATRRPVPITATADGVWIGRPVYRRAGLARVSPPADHVTGGILTWHVDLAPREEWELELEVGAVRGGEPVPVVPHDEPAVELAGPVGRPVPAITIRSDVPHLEDVVGRALVDLAALRLQDPRDPEGVVVAAGAPWYMTVFGRDSILTALMLLPFDPAIALSTARVLARLQGTRYDDETEEQPGRIVHEARPSHDVSLAFDDGHLYYGTVDATLLFVLLVYELWLWGTPLEVLRPLLPHVDAALDWAAGPGDPDGDGYVEYVRRTPTGLVNQGWKDSWDGISFADGRLPVAPIALAEVQGYAYAAWRAGARLAEATGDFVVAASRTLRATELRAAFRRDFWLPDRGWLACALDADKVPVDSLASNMGHCLWSGIVDPDLAAPIARWLVDEQMASGWGLRTLAASMARYDALSYHNGSVWPHDTAIAVAGLRRYGFAAEAGRLATDLLEAAAAVGGRPPELFAGFTRDDFPRPVPYPASCSPQAWASASGLLLCRTLLGLEPDLPNQRVDVDPILPEGRRFLWTEGIHLAGRPVTIWVEDDAIGVRGLGKGVAISRPS